MRKAEVISTLMDFQNQLCLDTPNIQLIGKDKLFRAIMASVNAVLDSPNDELDDN